MTLKVVFAVAGHDSALDVSSNLPRSMGKTKNTQFKKNDSRASALLQVNILETNLRLWKPAPGEQQLRILYVTLNPIS